MDLLLGILAGALGTATIVTIAGWLAKEVIATRLRASVQHEFERKIEILRSDFRVTEEHVRAQLSARESELKDLRGGALSAVAARRGIADKRRMEAIDQLWDGLSRAQRSLAAATIGYTFRIDAAAKEAAKNDAFKRMIDTLLPGGQPNLDLGESTKARLHVTPRAWAFFQGYVMIIGSGLARLVAVRNGIEEFHKLLDKDALLRTIKLALPHQSAWLDQYGGESLQLLLPELEQGLERELRSMIAGGDVDIETVTASAAIARVVASLATRDATQKLQEVSPQVVAAQPPAPAPAP